MPKRKQLIDWPEWVWRELREGGYFTEYFRRERAQATRRWRDVGRRVHGYRPNPKSELELKACVPARDFFRWKQTDPDFWCDDNNLRSLRRSDDAARDCIYNV